MIINHSYFYITAIIKSFEQLDSLQPLTPPYVRALPGHSPSNRPGNAGDSPDKSFFFMETEGA